MANNNDVKVIVDTNLWISWLIKKDFKKFDKLLISKKVKLIFSIELLNEFIEVSNRPKLKKYFDKEDIDILLQLIDEVAYFINVKTSIKTCRDEKDNFLLSLAIDSKADYLVTGDNDLLELKKIKGTHIVSINEFMKGI
jgi:putative PIN family toxin of toxin-antitoxin system